MLGRKIIQVYPDENTSLSAPNQTGLPVRKLKSAGLRIVTAENMNSSDTLQVPTSKQASRSVSAGSASAITPTTTHTFGRPNPTDKFVPNTTSPVLSPTSADSVREKRNLRYSRDEEALKSSLANSSREPSHRDLQIRALQQATDILNAHARDAKARAAKLRVSMGDKDLDPEDFVSLQRERWMEERRSQVRHEESLALSQLLTNLSHPDNIQVGSPSPLEAEKPYGGPDCPEKTRQAKRQANLLYYLNRSPTRLTFANRPPSSHPLTHHQHQRLQERSRPPLRRTISDIRTLRLRSTALISAFEDPISGRLRSRSLNVDIPPGISRQPSGVPLARAGTSRTTLSTPSLGVTLELDSDDDTTSSMFGRAQREVPPSPYTDGGVATIFSPASPRSLDELASDLSDIGIPSYARDLLNGLDNIHHEPILPSLPPPRPAFFDDEPIFRVPSSPGPTQSLLSVISSIHQDSEFGSPTSPSSVRGGLGTKFRGSHIGLHIPKPSTTRTRNRGAGSPLRRPLSTFFHGHSRQKSEDSTDSSSPPDSLSRKFVYQSSQDHDEDTATGESRVLQTPLGHNTFSPRIAGLGFEGETSGMGVGDSRPREKQSRWSVPNVPKSPGKVFMKMKNRLSNLGNGKK